MLVELADGAEERILDENQADSRLSQLIAML